MLGVSARGWLLTTVTAAASLFPAPIRYTGLSTVYQLSGVYVSGLTPLILAALTGVAGGAPWIACAYLVGSAIISVAVRRGLSIRTPGQRRYELC